MHLIDMDRHIEIKFLDEATEKMNQYVRSLVKNKKVKEADLYCEEKYAQIATAGFFKKILAYFTEHGEDNEVNTGADPAGIYEFVNAKLTDRVKIVRNTAAGINCGTGESDGADNGYISIDVGERVTLKLKISGPGSLAATVCVPQPDVWDKPVENEVKRIQPDDLQIPEPDVAEETAPLIFPVCRIAAFCEATEHIYENAHRLNEWVGLRCWRLAEKYEYLDYPKESVLAEVPEVWWDDWLEEASQKDKSDFDFVRKLISKRGECLKYAPEILKSDRKTVLKAIKDFSYSINYAAEELRNDKSFILEGIKKNAQLFEDISESFRDDREIAVAAIKQRIFNYEYASDRLKRDRDIIEMVMTANVYCLRYAPTDVLEDKDLVMRIVSERGDMLQYLPASMRADKEIVMTAVAARGACAAPEYGLGGIALSHALGGLKSDREVVLAAVRFCGFALESVSDELKDDREIVLIAVQNYGCALGSASKRLQDDRGIVFEAVKNDGTAFCFASERLRTDRELIITALQSAAGIFEDHEEAFFDIVQNIPADRLKAEPELAEKIYKLALAVDSEYYDEDSDPYEDSPERLPDRIKEYYEENIYYNHAGSDRCLPAGK